MQLNEFSSTLGQNHKISGTFGKLWKYILCCILLTPIQHFSLLPMSLRRLVVGFGGSLPKLWQKGMHFGPARSFCAAAASVKMSVSRNEIDHCKVENSNSNIKNETIHKGDENTDLIADKSYRERIGLLWRKYRYVFVLTYLSVYGATLSGMFYTLDSGLLTASTMGLESSDVIEKVGLVYCILITLMVI